MFEIGGNGSGLGPGRRLGLASHAEITSQSESTDDGVDSICDGYVQPFAYHKEPHKSCTDIHKSPRPVPVEAERVVVEYMYCKEGHSTIGFC